MVQREVVCINHSGHEARIEQCEKDVMDISNRLLELEKEVWKAAGASGVITGLISGGMIILAEKVMR